ncbi:ABC transporter permease [Paenibacillus lemnae]|uniref:ABC transporter permease n=1 Tax=Paenibacillus lemnae TaxID=1330551 RepID=A0A848MBK8_PAELE|nr:ABC transporter permease [Paenibacillus lemnae]NMO97403.1 ABC transporter permease [Paenibacillus lemnae]
MNFRQFALNNVLRSKRTYIAHFMSSAFSVMVFFIYAMLAFHPNLENGIMSSSGTVSQLGTMGMKVSQVIVFVFSFFFLLYSVGAFMKVRQKEFGILLVLGMSRKQLNRMLFIENLVIGAAAIAGGIGAGLIFSKLTLLISASLLAVDEGLPFYVPGKAVLLTVGAYAVLFIVVALFSSILLRKGTLISLVKSDETPKSAPKASVWLAILAVLLMGGGYVMVMVFAVLQIFSLPLLFGGVVLVITGTYFLYTQFSVYYMKRLQRKPHVFFRKTNLLTISELIYRIRDNAVMFFMVTIISASAFTGIGTALTVGDPGLSGMENPYAFTFVSFEEDRKKGEEQLNMIRHELEQSGIQYREASFNLMTSDNGYPLITLSQYNGLLASMGLEESSLAGDESILTPGSVGERNRLRLEGVDTEEIEIMSGILAETVKVVRAEELIVIPHLYGNALVIPDDRFQRFHAAQEDEVTAPVHHTFYVEDWKETGEVSSAIAAALDQGDGEYSSYFTSLYSEWKSSRQENGVMLMVSGLIGIVFFTFAASFIYFRLYADLSRDEQQYRMIAKVGLSRRELRKIVTQQLAIMFFLPIVIAVIHSGVAFLALQQLVDFSILGHTIKIFIFFLGVQILFFLITRWRYLDRMYKTIQ